MTDITAPITINPITITAPVGTGLVGPQGPQGIQGEPGPAGADGADAVIPPSQYDTRTDLTATNGATVTLNYSLGNSFVIDASALAAGNSFTVAVSNWPAGAAYAALTLILTTGANIPTISWPTGVTGPTLQASKSHWYTLATSDNGTTTRLFSAGVF